MSFCELALLHYQIYLVEININLKFYFTTKANWHMRCYSPIFLIKIKRQQECTKCV